jgi:dsRNA-specific ribonuclease
MMIAFYQCRTSLISITTHPSYKEAFSPAFNSLTFHGDRHLAMISGSIIAEFFGEDNNKNLLNIIAADWVSNRNWMMLAVSYRLDRYAGWAIKNHRQLLKAGSNLSMTLLEYPKKEHDTGEIKYWADLWEAWWACVFRERELWNEDIDDIKSIFRQLIFFKYQKILKYSTWNWALKSSLGQLNVAVAKDDVTVTKVVRSDPEMEECLGPSTEQTKVNTFGYIAKLAIHKDTRDVTVFAASKDDAVEKIIEFANSGRSRIITLFMD